MLPQTAEEATAVGVIAPLLTAAQAAQILGISTRRLRDWRKEGRIAEAGRFKRGTARVPLFDPAEVMRAKAAAATEETPEASATDAAAFAQAVARLVGLMLTERAEAEAATVAPLVAQITDQAERIGHLEAEREGVKAQLTARDQALTAKDETIAELRRRAEVAEEEVVRRRSEEAERLARVSALVREREAASGIRRSGSMLRKQLDQVSDEQEGREAWGAAPPAPRAPTFWERVRTRLRGE